MTDPVTPTDAPDELLPDPDEDIEDGADMPDRPDEPVDSPEPDA